MRSVRVPRLAAAITLLLAVVGLTACGSSSSSGGGARTAVAVDPPSSGCGSFSAPQPKDPDHVFATLPPQAQKLYLGYPTVMRSAWTQFKARHAPPYSVGVVMNGSVNQYQVDLVNDLTRALKANPLIGKVNVLTSGATVNVPLQVQQLQSVVRSHPDIILMEPTQPEAFLSVVEQAGRAGIPAVTFLSAIDSPYALNVNVNPYRNAALTASYMARQLGGKGHMLFVHGYPSVTTDILDTAGTMAVLRGCPGIKLAGAVYGGFINSAAKAETLKFLATHPGRIDMVQQVGAMAQGAMSAFQATGRPVPPIGNLGAQIGPLAYWRDHRATYHGVATGQGAPSVAQSVVDVAVAVLQGRGPRTNTILAPPTMITDANLDQWVRPGDGVDDVGNAAGPAGSFLPKAYLDSLFERAR